MYYHWNEKWSPTHPCKNSKIYFLQGGEEVEETKSKQQEIEVIEQKEAVVPEATV